MSALFSTKFLVASSIKRAFTRKNVLYRKTEKMKKRNLNVTREDVELDPVDIYYIIIFLFIVTYSWEFVAVYILVILHTCTRKPLNFTVTV